jgi:hypothetical protein
MPTQAIVKVTDNVYPYAQLFDVEIMMIKDGYNRYINSLWQWIARILILEASTSPLKMSFAIENLPLGEYYVRFLPQPKMKGDDETSYNRNIFRLGVNKEEYSKSTGMSIYDVTTSSNKEIFLKGVWIQDNLESTNLNDVGIDVYRKQGDEVIKEREKFNNLGDLFWCQHLPSYLEPETEKWSSEQSPPITISSISESKTVPFPLTNYQGNTVGAVKIKASQRLQSVPPIIHDITKGKILKKIKCAGKVTSTSGNTINSINITTSPVFTYPSTNPEYPVPPNLLPAVSIESGDYIINTSNYSNPSQIGTVSSVSNGSLSFSGNLLFEKNDDFLVFTYGSSSFLPDIFLDLLTSENGGLWEIFKGYDHVDVTSLFKAKQYCYQKGYFWDGLIDTQTPFARWAFEQAKTCKLLPTRINGQYGLLPETENDTPVAVFNETNIIKDSYEEAIRPERETNLDRIVINYTDGFSELKPNTNIVIMYSEGGGKPIKQSFQEQQLNLYSITRPRQALEVGASVLKSARMQKRVISFKTSFNGLFINTGDLIIVQHKVSEIQDQKSGRVLEVINGASSVTLVLSTEFENYFEYGTYTFAFQALSKSVEVNTEDIFTDLGCSRPSSSPLLPNQLYVTGDGYLHIREGDPFVLSLTTSSESIYRVLSIDISEDYQCSITAVQWDESVFNLQNIYSEPSITEIMQKDLYTPERATDEPLRVKKQEWWMVTTDNNRIQVPPP